jgi:uncharacterized membrane protein HdeD (DUF308 family)
MAFALLSEDIMTKTNVSQSTSELDPAAAVLAQNWWAITMRGALGILFGLVALFLPGATMLSLVLLFASYVFVDGIFAIISAVCTAHQYKPLGLFILEGVVNIIMAIIAFAWPGITAAVFVLIVALWAILSGGLILAAALRLDDGRWWLIFGGIASLIYGVLLIAAPMIGTEVLVWWLGAYVLVFGIALLVLGVRLRAGQDGVG